MSDVYLERRINLPTTGSHDHEKPQPSATEERQKYVLKLTSALFYALASFLITVVNKLVLTSSG